MSRKRHTPPPPCGKRRLSEGKAAGVVRSARRSGLSHRQEQRVYFCRGCEAWHTTASPFRTYEQRAADYLNPPTA